MSPIDGRDLQTVHRIDTDVVIIGSGPAGSAVARVLSRGGARVVVLEAGPRVGPDGFALSAFSSMSSTYRGLGATLALGRTATPLVQGKMVGGSSPINGAICWRMPRDIYDGWCTEEPAIARGMPWDELEATTDEIEARLKVAPTQSEVAGRKNQLMADGAEALGLEHRPIRRNVDSCEGLGRCMQGCPRGHKRSADRSLLLDAEQAGSIVYSHVEAKQITTHRGRATGVVARAVGGGVVNLRVRHAVVLAASAIQSPALLLQSGLNQGPVGEGFQGHPGVSMAGRFAEPVRMWEGATQGHEVIGFRKEGLKFEALGFDLTVLAARLDGVGSGFAARIADLAHWVEWGAAIRSTARGRVRVVLGQTLVTWSPTERDIALYRRGLRVLGEMMLAAGAESVSPGLRGVPNAIRDPAILGRLEEEGPRRASDFPAVITHMFGTCRMGTHPSRSVVGPDFQHHGVAGLYIADSSVFPTNTGVNPQIAIMAVATLCGRRVLGAAAPG